MQTKLKPLFLLMSLAAMAVSLYAANDSNAQTPTKGIFDVSAFTPKVISITPKLGHPDAVTMKDSVTNLPAEQSHELR